jgi:hypothetical protein
MRARSNVILISLFSVLLVIPTLAGWAGYEPMQRFDEKRPLSPQPAPLSSLRQAAVTAAALTALAQQWDRYYSDHFGLRKLLVGGYRFITVHALNTSLHPAVVIGKVHDGQRWYFYNGSAAGDGSGLESLLGKRPYTDEELALTAANVRHTVELTKGRGIKFVLMIVPDKQSVYPELLPNRFRPPKGARSRLDQFWTATQASEGSGLIDLRGPLGKAKRERQLYMATDTHWTEQGGAFVAYQNLIAALRHQDQGPEALAREQVEWKPWDLGQVPGDCAVMMGLPLFGGEVVFNRKLPPNGSLGRPRGKKAFVLADSFIEAIKPYLEFEYDEVESINGARSATQMHISQELLDAHKPDLVLIEAVERYWTM